MTPYMEVLVTNLSAEPGPVLILDTCSLLDLFRREEKLKVPRVPTAEIRAAAEIIRQKDELLPSPCLVVPELVPKEYADHCDRIEFEFRSWFRDLDDGLNWVTDVGIPLGLNISQYQPVESLGIFTACRSLANDLLKRSIVLDRDPHCVERAVTRVINKRRPSHNNQIKDSINLEQSLEFSRQLQAASFGAPCIFVSSNTSDYADKSTSGKLHHDLEADFTGAGLKYSASLREAWREIEAIYRSQR